MDHDVAIIGAGAAGIAAARVLVANGRSVVVLEASDRVGGRGWTIGMAGMTLDLGCGWLHSAERNPLVAEGEAANFTVHRGPSAWQEQWRGLGFTPAEQAAARAAWAALDARFHAAPPESDRASDALEPGGAWNAFCRALSGYMNGADLDRLSIADFLAYDDAASENNWRVHEGYGALLAARLPHVELRLTTPARRVALGDRGVRIETDRGTVSARAAIVTASSNVLASGAMAFDPAATDHLHAAAQLPLGLADKLFFELIGNHGLEVETHLIGNPRDANTGSYYVRPLGQPVIEAFFGGPGAQQLERVGVAEAFRLAADELAGLLGSDIRRHLRPIAASAWCRTAWINGSYSHALPGQAHARATLAKPLDGRIFFAGEATHATDFSTAHGAWQSGIRAAREILEAQTA
ncbi:NAD(P)/FAD-dependent oxidoreductase [Sphingomonas sp. H39-1-10]|uniref:flavin monoamine oxidase family protein n=1 Tax=Sphingomonas pollutisoli TaxID=3030829 RepID=UPI0023B9E68A|nr:NAD(P)/FAD-dependent oxidoreductase [Sphingomonas pollutisoli]MDF0488749.1 NAD(P)/FAD-dependent oxidoreductase [Sphingomonas pollutisoli]